MTNRGLPSSALGWLILLWGVGGVFLFILSPVLRLAGVAVLALEHELTAVHAVVAVVWVVFMVYAEGWRGFHKQFAPRVVVRSLELANKPSLWPAIFAPLTAMGLIHATRKRLLVSRILLGGIVLLVVVVRQSPQPWRGIIDSGVVLGLGVGLLSIAGWFVAALMGSPSQMASDMPE